MKQIKQLTQSLIGETSRSSKNLLNTAMFFLNFCMNNKTYTFLVASYYLLPFAIAHYEKMFFEADCGNFEMFNTDNEVPGYHFTDKLNRFCFAPFQNYPSLIFCREDTPVDHKQGQLIVTIHGTPAGTDICEQWRNLHLHFK